MKSKNIVPQAYSPLGSTNAPLLTDEVVTQIAAKHSLKPVDVLLGYLRTLIHAYNILNRS
jgi:glycerol 2-dehydrogenase (NADP+)